MVMDYGIVKWLLPGHRFANLRVDCVMGGNGLFFFLQFFKEIHVINFSSLYINVFLLLFNNNSKVYCEIF